MLEFLDTGSRPKRCATRGRSVATKRRLIAGALIGLLLLPLYAADEGGKSVPEASPKAAAPPVQVTALPQGARIAMIGDSITAQRLYTRVIETYLVACAGRKDLSFCTYGWSGGTLYTFMSPMSNDITCFKPSVVTLAFGMNDGSYRPINDYIRNNYSNQLRKSIQLLQAQGVPTIVVGSPGAVDTKFFSPPHPREQIPLYEGATDYGVIYNSTLGTLTDLGRAIAAESRCPFVDLHTPLIETMKRAKATLGDTYDVCGTDGYHPRANGGFIMAYAFLKGLGCDGTIGEITIDEKGQATASAGHVITKSTAGQVVITSSRYPFCFDPDPRAPTSTRSILPFLPFNQELNRLILRVKNLDTPRAKIVWGSETMEFARAELEAGINLAEKFTKTPFDAAFQDFLTAIMAKQDKEEGLLMFDISTHPLGLPAMLGTLHPTEPQKAAEVKQLLAQLKAELGEYRDLREREIYGALPTVTHTIEVQPVRAGP